MSDEYSHVAVSPKHSVRLAREYVAITQKPQRRDFVVRTLARRLANGMPLMTAEIVIAGEETRAEFQLAEKYPLHFRKTYFPGRLHGDPKEEFSSQAEAHRLIGVPPPIGFGPQVFRTCLIPGTPYGNLSPFKSDPEERNLPYARELELTAAVGQWKLAEQAFERLQVLHDGGLAHGDAELHNFIVSPSPVEIAPIDFEAAIRKESVSADVWEARLVLDLDPLLKHAVYLQCALGAQSGGLAECASVRLAQLFKDPDRFRREIDEQSDLG